LNNTFEAYTGKSVDRRNWPHSSEESLLRKSIKADDDSYNELEVYTRESRNGEILEDLPELWIMVCR